MASARPTLASVPLDVPPDRLAPLIGRWPQPALLESGPGFGAAGRWSVYAARPRLVFEAHGDAAEVTDTATGLVTRAGNVWDTLDALLRRFRLADPSEPPDDALPPFFGGLVGYLGYDLAPLIERLPRRAPRDSAFPDARLALYDTVVTVDHETGDVRLWADDLLDEGESATADRVSDWLEALAQPVPARTRFGEVSPLKSNFQPEAYLDAVRRALEYIAAGDVFQINLSQRFEARGLTDPLELYLRLKDRSPSPFASYLAWDDLAVVGASPEWFYQTRGDAIVTRPIKGTRPRGKTPADDDRLARELAASPKDRAELTMIVDLERNDLGRVCRYGTVRVTEPLTVESYAQVHHLVATVEGRLRPEVGPVDVIRAVFPGGSITGAPKIRAMEIIDELEPTRRGVYTGAVGYFGRGGRSGLNIVIRTATVEGDLVRFQVGGGIVADSVPETEYEETLHKGRALREVLTGQEG